MSEQKSPADEKFVVKFPLISHRLYGQSNHKSKFTDHKRCKQCSVLLLNIDCLLESETISLKALERQFNTCRNKCRKRGICTNDLSTKLSPSSLVKNDVVSSEDQEYAVVIKQEPLSPASVLLQTENLNKELLSEVPCGTGTIESCGRDEQHPVVEVKVERVDTIDEEYTCSVTVTNKEATDSKMHGINKEFRIKEKAPCKPVHDLYETKATDLLRQVIAKTAIVQPTVFTSTNTSTASNPLLRNVLSSMQTSATTSVVSVSTQSPIWGRNNLKPVPETVNTSRPAKVVNNSNKIPISKLPSSSTSSSLTSASSTTTTSSGEMSVLQLMNGQMVLVPTNTMKKLCASYPSLVTSADVSQNVINVNSASSASVAGTLPILTSIPQPTIAILPPTGPDLITPTLTPQLFNIPGQTNPNLLGQQGLGNQIVLMQQTGNSNSPLLLQPGGNQSPNLFAMSDPTSIQIPNVPVVQQIAAPFIPALPTMQLSNEKKTENSSDTKPMSKTSFLRLADGQLVPIVCNPSSFSQNMSITSAVKSNDSPKLSLATNLASPIPCIAQTNGNAQLQFLVPAVPIQEKSPPSVMQCASTTVSPSVNEKAKQSTTRFIQLANGTLIPITTTIEQNQISLQTNNTTSLLSPANENLNQQRLSEDSLQVPSPSAASALLKKNHIPSLHRSNYKQDVQHLLLQDGRIVPVKKVISESLPARQTRSLKANNGITSSSFLMDRFLNNASGKSFRFHNTFHTPTSKGSDVQNPENSGKKQQPVILQTNRPKQRPRNVKYNRLTHLRHTKTWSDTLKASTAAPYIQIAPKEGSSDTSPHDMSTGKGNSQKASAKSTNKRKPVNVVREEFDVHNRKRPKTYFTQEVIDLDEEPDPPPKDEEGRPKFMFMRNVSQPAYRPVLLDSTVEEKGLRIPDNMLF